MRIGIDIRAIGQQRTGDETYTLQLVKSLAKVDTDNHYFLYTDTKDRKKIQEISKLLDIKNEKFTIQAVTAPNRFVWTALSLPGQGAKDKLDILHVQYLTPFKRKYKFKIITTIHDISFARFPQFISKKDLFLLKLFLPASLRRADGIIAVSEFTAKEIEEVYDLNKNKIYTVYNGGVAKDFLKDISDDQVLSFRKKYDIIKPYLLYLGTLQPRKNIPFLIEVFAEFKEKHRGNNFVDSLELVLRGTRYGRNYDRTIDEAINNIQNSKIKRQIKFVGYIQNEEAPLIFKGAEVFCFPSVYEGFGLPLLEAMSVGTPTIASKASCFPEISAGASCLCELNDKNDWIRGLEGVLFDKERREKLITLGHKRVKDFSWEKCARETLKCYNSLT